MRQNNAVNPWARWAIALLLPAFAARSAVLVSAAPASVVTSSAQGLSLDSALYRVIYDAWKGDAEAAMPILQELGGNEADDGVDALAFEGDSPWRHREGTSSPLTPRGGGGWVARWLSMGGEGTVTVHLGAANLTIPHRPAAFPARLSSPHALPLSGFLVPYPSFPSSPSPPDDQRRHSSPSNPSEDEFSPEVANDSIDVNITLPRRPSPTPPPTSDPLGPLACSPLPPLVRPPPTPHSKPYKIALVERGSCDFARKVINAQLRGASAVIVGDSKLRPSETREEGLTRDGLITMFSPEDTELIGVPAVFVSRASWIRLNELVANGTDSGRHEGRGVWVDIGEGTDDGNALSSLLSFSLLMPSLFLLATIALHRFRMARRRVADRAPPLVVLSLPERVWTPDIAWEEKSSSSGSPTPTPTSATTPPVDAPRSPSAPEVADQPEASGSLPDIPPISPSDIRTPPAVESADPISSGPPTSTAKPAKKERKPRTVSQTTATATRYFGKDECAICMDAFVKGDVVRILPCGHVFHKDECDEWLLKWRKLCPTCRADVTLPAGQTLPQAAGTTMTPVTTREEAEQAALERSWVFRARRAVEAARAGVVAHLRRPDPRGQAEGVDQADERTPLVRNEHSTERQGEGTV